ncbi:MAG: metallophosphoesterase family protein [Planctomycetota bacterium]
MKRIAWATDTHFDFVEQAAFNMFLERLEDASPDVLLLSGDIAESRNLVECLVKLDNHLDCFIYFVLGNHDFYHGSIAGVRGEVRSVCKQREKLVYLTDEQCVEISEGVGLVGHDGWGDGRVGNYQGSTVTLSDFSLIHELAGLSKQERWAVLKALGDESAAAIRQSLPQALERYARVFFVTHVPPLRDACWHNGSVSDDHWAPLFTCQAVGDVVMEIAGRHRQSELTVLCGHTHSPGKCCPSENVRIITGGAEYGFPIINQVFRV